MSVDLDNPNNWIRVHPDLHAKYVGDSQRLHELLENIPYETEMELVQVIKGLRAEIEELWHAYAHDADPDVMTAMFEKAVGKHE